MFIRVFVSRLLSHNIASAEIVAIIRKRFNLNYVQPQLIHAFRTVLLSTLVIGSQQRFNAWFDFVLAVVILLNYLQVKRVFLWVCIFRKLEVQLSRFYFVGGGRKADSCNSRAWHTNFTVADIFAVLNILYFSGLLHFNFINLPQTNTLTHIFSLFDHTEIGTNWRKIAEILYKLTLNVKYVILFKCSLFF